jgi:hypothetical protein
VPPLSSSLLAQSRTADSHDLQHNRGSAAGYDNITETTPSGSIQPQLNENTDKSTRHGADVNGSPLVSSAMNIDENANPSREATLLPEASREHGARDVLHDAVASALEMVGDAAVVQDSTQTQSGMMQVTSSTQKDSPSEPRESHTKACAADNSDASQPPLVPQGSASMATERNEAKTPAPLTGNVIYETGLQDVVAKLETSPSPTDKDCSSLRSVFFKLYLDEEADPLEPQCCVKLTGLTTRDELFTMMHDDLQDDLDDGDQIVAVKVKRADGEVFRGPNVRTMPIKRVGRQDMWRELINTLLEHGAGEEGLRGYVKVKKFVDAK